jgi:C4-dicarboxylate-specific signal transduction histidine kinase
LIIYFAGVVPTLPAARHDFLPYDRRALSGLSARDADIVRSHTSPGNGFSGRKIHEASLPAEAEVRMRDPTPRAQYSTHVIAACIALLLQAAVICWLIFERRCRRITDAAARNSMAELAHMNRLAGAGVLWGTIAHEVNQPLTGITTRAVAALRWLSEETPDINRSQAALLQIIDAGHRASEIITNVRMVFKNEMQEKGPVDINKVIRQVLALTATDFKKSGVEIRLELDDSLPPVAGFATQLQQVMLNLIMNAIESMQCVQFRVLTVQSEQRQIDRVCVSIEDTGTGIDPTRLVRVFEPLFTTKARGIGVGLSICQSIIENHGGQIWASPGPTKGSVFRFELPVAVPAKCATAGTEQPWKRHAMIRLNAIWRTSRFVVK